jgi:hypothetical protein
MSKKAKRSYEKPKICEVKLAPEEAVLMACKTTASVGPEGQGVGMKCANPCASGPGS